MLAGLNAVGSGAHAPRFVLAEGLPAVLARDPELALRIVLSLDLRYYSNAYTLYPA